MDYYVFTFNTISDALAAEKLVSNYGGTIISIPTEISTDCGFAIKFIELKSVISAIKSEIVFTNIYGITGRGKTKVIKKIDYTEYKEWEQNNE